MSYHDLFQELNREEIRYVIPRRYDSLPEDTIDEDGDVDIVVEPSQFRAAVNLCKRTGFSTEKDTNNRLRMCRNALSKPTKAIQLLAHEPKKSVTRLATGNGFQSENSRHKNEKLYRKSQMVDLRNNLAYESPMNGSRIPVHPSVTKGMLERRQTKGCFYIPTPADELAHLISHCTFNKDGEFSTYYADRCEELFSIVRSNEEQRRLFEHLLEKIYFNADQLVFDLVAEKRYSDIRTELKRFSDY